MGSDANIRGVWPAYATVSLHLSATANQHHHLSPKMSTQQHSTEVFTSSMELDVNFILDYEYNVGTPITSPSELQWRLFRSDGTANLRPIGNMDFRDSPVVKRRKLRLEGLKTSAKRRLFKEG